MQSRRYESGGPDTPAVLRRYFHHGQRSTVTACGDVRILDATLTAFFCSIQCPGGIILQIYDLALKLRSTDVTLIGGFHSPMEKEFLDLLLRGTASVVACPARGIEDMRIPREWRPAIEEGRLLVLSPFGRSHRRATAALAGQRNEFVAALAKDAFIPYAAPDGKIEALAREHAAAGKTILTFNSPANANLRAIGARPLKSGRGNGEERTGG